VKTIKNAIVIVIFLSVGYGAHVVLNKPVAEDSYDYADQGPFAAPLVDVGNAEPQRPAISIGGQYAGSSPQGRDESLPLGGNPSQAQIASQPVPQEEQRPAQPIMASESSANARNVAQVSATSDPVPDPTATVTEAVPGHTPSNAEEYGAATESGPSTADDHVGRPSTAGDFENDWHAAQMKLEQGQLADALFTLSLWCGDHNVSDYRAAELTPLLDQLAGTVIYSGEHHLEQPYVVPANTTLEQVGQEYQVPTMFLARINGLVPPFRLTPGQQLKVVRGPFRAEISRARHELTLFLGSYYGGRFVVNVGAAARVPQDTLEVAEKLAGRLYLDPNTKDEIPAGHPNNPYGRHWIGLRQLTGSAQADLGIHGTGEACGTQDLRACVGLSPIDVEDLYAILSVGSKVTVTD
jgi:lipoprotein-anchoring transpeptidase ErfK/SrfK